MLNRAKFTSVWWELSLGNCERTLCVPVLTHTFPRESLLSPLIDNSPLAGLGNARCFVNQSCKQDSVCASRTPLSQPSPLLQSHKSLHGKQGSGWAEFSEELPPVLSAKLRRPGKTRRAVLCLSRDGREDLIGVFYLLISSSQIPQA